MGAYTLPDGFTEFDMFAFGSALLVGGRLKKVDWRLAPVKYEQGQTTFLSKRMLGFFLNAISIVAFLRVKEMRTPSNFFVFNLAVADLSLNINGLTAAYASHLRYWPFGQDGCAYHGFQGMIALLASMSFMAVIAWDRYHQYCTRQKLFWSTTLTMSGIIWILSIFWAAVPLMGWGVYDFEPMRTCCTLDYTRGDRDYVTFMLTLLLLYLIFPAFTMVSCYKSIYKQFKKVHHHRFNTSLPTRVMLMCWGPYILMCIYACFQNVKVISPKLRMVLPVVAKTNPIFNALLYSFGNEFYRGGLWNFLTGQKIVEPDLKKSK